jgi:hypothetical protein
MKLPSNSVGPYQIRAYFGDAFQSSGFTVPTNTVISGSNGTSITGSLASGPLSGGLQTAVTAEVTDNGDGILEFTLAKPAGASEGYWCVVGLELGSGGLPPESP